MSMVSTCQLNPYEVISVEKKFSGLKNVIDLAGLKTYFSNLCNATFFAPTNDALASNPALVEYLAEPQNKQLLIDVLKYHVYPFAALTTSQLVPTTILPMSNGKITTIYAALYYPFVPVVQDQIQQNFDVTEGNISSSTMTYIQAINGILQPEVIYYAKYLNPPNSIWNKEQLNG